MIAASPPPPRHIATLRRIRRSAWLALLLSLPLHVTAAPVPTAIPFSSHPLEYHP